MSSSDLVFFQPPGTSALVYGDEETGANLPPRLAYLAAPLPALTLVGVIGPVVDAFLAATLPPLAMVARFEHLREVSLAATLPALTLSGSITYDNSVTRYLQGAVTDGLQPALAPRPTHESSWGVSVSKRGGHDIPHQVAVRSGEGADSPTGVSLYKLLLNQMGYKTADRAGLSIVAKSETALRRHAVRRDAYQLGVHVGMNRNSSYQTGINRRYWIRDSNWQPAVRKGGTRQGRSGAGPGWRGVQAAASHWQTSKRPDQGRYVVPPDPTPPEGYLSDANLLFSWPFGYSTPDMVFQSGDYIAPPPVVGPVVVQIQRVYIVLNSASLRRVDGNIYLPSFGMTLSLDMSSWTWGFTATLPGSTLSSLEPSSLGAPVEVEAMINGVAYRAFVESISRTRTFGKSDISVSGRGKTSLLDSPYAPVQSFTNAIDRTAQQLIDDVLSVNGVSMGWGVDFGLEDWLVPAGVFAHQGSYISALNAIAGSVGGYVQPHASAQSLRVLPRYPSTPWTWSSATPDYELPASVTTQEGIEWVEKARYNRVFVSGVKSGVLGQVTRAGTDGAILAPMVTDSLITTAAAARQRGLSVLGDTGRIANVKLRLPVLAETGIITPGKMVKYVDGATSRTGIVRSVNVDVGMPEIFQTIGVETHVN